ncbi:hypothetical protein CC86DRAFT_367605 [Ophiobolus disseminans]|uniref:DUF1531-domain-containing protein n=1 Tax=Ophiobolus disseminans TaxID=1469910 RepID=A0A6A7A8M2_9PLEO|nr:hypothetical protein CC86DRAFT_367605 [Ophiobolus disseminans]
MDYIFDNLSIAKDRLVSNSIKSFEGMTAQRWIRVIVIVGGYMLVRPYLLKFAADRQKAQFEKEADELGLGEGRGPNANDLRGGKATKGTNDGAGKVLGEVKDEGKEDWGNSTKTRQRKNVEKKLMEAEELEEEREIRQFLRD